MPDRTVAIVLGLLATLAFVLFVVWHSDVVLKAKCRHAGGHWDAASRSCLISAGPVGELTVSPQG